MRGFNSKKEEYLFSKGDWLATQEAWRDKLVRAIEEKNGNELLNTSTEDLAQFYAENFKFEVPVLLEDELVVSEQETQVDVSQDWNRDVRDRSQPCYITGTSIDVEIPYDGNKVGFDLCPSTWSTLFPRAYIDNEALKFSITGSNLISNKVRDEINQRIELINSYLGYLSKDAKGYNSALVDVATQKIEQRKCKLLNDQSLVSGLGFKIKTRPGQSETFATQKVRRKIRPTKTEPTASREPYKPEPIITDENYELILTVMENMATVMEKSPEAFKEINEENLRMHFLMQLNGHFQGEATAETFNYEGKTDILIKDSGKNIFIGECKFWAGEKGYLETIDQILSYLSWRDTKAAILIFSRNNDFTNVLAKIEESTSKHSSFKKLVRKRSETSWSYLFGHKDNPNREIYITVQAYNVPKRHTELKVHNFNK